MAEIAVSVRGLGKRYRIAHQRQKYGRLTESLSGALQAPIDRLRGRPRETTEWFWALRDVSFDLNHGEVLGVIGRNGAGKSTLLKILSRITEPTTGSAELRGRVGSLLEVGTGFHPELTGRENIYMSGSVLGMQRAEIRRRFDEIAAFAEVEQFLDTPVKRYSSGMQVRLGFAVAAHLEPEILVVDEVLAVGDLEFQRKCLAKMGDVAHGGRTILFVSHNMAAIENLCTTSLLLDRGAVVAEGGTRDVIDQYIDTIASAESPDVAGRKDRQGDGRMRLVGVETSIRTGSPSSIRLEYVAQLRPSNVSVLIGVYTMRGEGALWLSTEIAGAALSDMPERGTIICSFEKGSLMPGRYSMNVWCAVAGTVADYVTEAAVFDVAEGDFFGTGKLPPPDHGPVVVAHTWGVERS